MYTGFVVDASVIVAALVDSGRDGSWAEDILSGGHLAAPELAILESLNILRRLEAAGQLTELEAAAARQDLHDLDLELAPVRPLEERIWALRRNLTAYDACYVAVAEALDEPLATLDRRLAAAPGLKCTVVTPPKRP
jgi:predicted nucleic acid-binding protein